MNKKWEKKESDLLKELALRSEEWRKREQELTQDLLTQTNEVKAALKLAEGTFIILFHELRLRVVSDGRTGKFVIIILL